MHEACCVGNLFTEKFLYSTTNINGPVFDNKWTYLRSGLTQPRVIYHQVY